MKVEIIDTLAEVEPLRDVLERAGGRQRPAFLGLADQLVGSVWDGPSFGRDHRLG